MLRYLKAALARPHGSVCPRCGGALELRVATRRQFLLFGPKVDVRSFPQPLVQECPNCGFRRRHLMN